VTAADADLLLDLYRRMLVIRGVEDRVQSRFLRGEVYGTTHLHSGQEAVAVGVGETEVLEVDALCVTAERIDGIDAEVGRELDEAEAGALAAPFPESKLSPELAG
jgi:hypothetical protein